MHDRRVVKGASGASWADSNLFSGAPNLQKGLPERAQSYISPSFVPEIGKHLYQSGLKCVLAPRCRPKPCRNPPLASQRRCSKASQPQRRRTSRVPARPFGACAFACRSGARTESSSQRVLPGITADHRSSRPPTASGHAAHLVRTRISPRAHARSARSARALTPSMSEPRMRTQAAASRAPAARARRPHLRRRKIKSPQSPHGATPTAAAHPIQWPRCNRKRQTQEGAGGALDPREGQHDQIDRKRHGRHAAR